MAIPDRFRSSFSTSTLKTVERQASHFELADGLFFRGAYTANVIEHERRRFAPVIALDSARVVSSRCTCSVRLRPNDLCRHLAVLVERMAGEDGLLLSETYERSVWRAVAFAAFSEGCLMEAEESDPREQMLRRYVLTEQEQALLQRGSGSARLLFEASAWYRWSKDVFLHGVGDARIELRERGLDLVLPGPPIQRIALPAAAIEHLIASAPDIVQASGFDVAPNSLTPTLRIELTSARTLRFIPAVVAEDARAHDRASLQAFGRYLLLGNRFCSIAPIPPMFVEEKERSQAALFEIRSTGGLPFDRESVVAEGEVFAFIERHRRELGSLAEELAPEAVRRANPLRLDGEVWFDFAGMHKDFLEIEVTFQEGSESITAAEIARARRDGVRAFIRGNVWIDVEDPQFAWLDGATMGPRGQTLVTKLELLRIRGLLRGRVLFRGDPACQSVFSLFDETQAQTDAPTPASLGMDLYGYQQTGYQWLWLLQKNGFGGLLCDDMGLGKTHQAIALIAACASVSVEGASPEILVVCPTSVVDHWRATLARLVPHVPVRLTTYGLVRSRFEQFRGKRFDLMIIDEMQTIKNADTATYQALRGIEARVAIGLTGTPIENHEGELHALLDFVVPGYLPKHVDDRATLRRLVRPFVLRRTKAQVLTQLPAKIVDKRYCELTSEQRILYRRVIEARASPLRAKLRAGETVSYVHIFAALNYLKQICNHPASAGGGFGGPGTSGKWEMLLELLEECRTSGLKVVVFSQYLAMLGLIEEHLALNGIGYASIQGSTRDRGGEIARFREDPDCRVFVVSLRAGGLGIDLTSASVVIHYDRWWNQAREDQATDRVHRLGQSKGVQVIKLITRHTIEEKIDALITQKGTLVTELVHTDDPALVKQFTRDELDDLLSEL